MIIYEKIKEKYSPEELKERVGRSAYFRMQDNKPVKLNALYSKLDLKDIKYSEEDLIKDYPQYEKYIEKKTLLNIIKNGYSVEYLSKENDINVLVAHVWKGFNYNSQKYDGKEDVLKLLKIDYDISNFKLEIYKRHIELYGDKEELEKFREKFSIDRQVLYEKYKEKWHLAFDGLLAEYIKIKSRS